MVLSATWTNEPNVLMGSNAEYSENTVRKKSLNDKRPYVSREMYFQVFK